MWERDEERLALLELLTRGRLRRRESQSAAWDWLIQLPWTRRTNRHNELELVESRRETAQGLLDQVWPDWSEALARLEEARLPPTEAGWRDLQDRERATERPAILPGRLNLRTATSIVAPHSKAALTESRREVLAEVDLTRDGLVRLRPNAGLRISRDDNAMDAMQLAGIVGEIVLSERALRDGTSLCGESPLGLLLVENLGPYLDVSVPVGWSVAHVPGWNTAAIRVLLERLPAIPTVHFGDLDPNGVRIYRHLKKARPDLGWLVPDFWNELVPKRCLRAIWPDELSLEDAPTLVRELAANRLWLEQETIALDPRIVEAITACRTG